MDGQTIAIVCAGLGVVGSVVWFVLLRRGVRTLGEIRDRLPVPNERDDT
jgi:hypothetical protein